MIDGRQSNSILDVWRFHYDGEIPLSQATTDEVHRCAGCLLKKSKNFTAAAGWYIHSATFSTGFKKKTAGERTISDSFPGYFLFILFIVFHKKHRLDRHDLSYSSCSSSTLEFIAFKSCFSNSRASATHRVRSWAIISIILRSTAGCA